MRLTPILHSFLNRVWGRDPKAVPAFQIVYAGQLSWGVADQVLTLSMAEGQTITLNMAQYTVAALVTYLVSQGFSIIGVNPAVGSFKADVLLDGEGDQSEPLTAYTSLRWAILDAIAKQLYLAEQCAAAAAAQLATVTASGYWLDVLGSYLGDLMRAPGELDGAYALRIPASILQPKCNNVAMAIAIQDALGLVDVMVTDVTVYGPTEPVFDGSIKFDGSHVYNASPISEYGLFDVTGYSTAPTAQAAALNAAVAAFVETARAAGTHLRNVNILGTGGQILADGSGQSLQADGGGTLFSD